jgi:hypothetical protein
MRGFFTLLLAAAAPALCSAQGIPDMEWQACFGGSGYELGYCIHQTTDGGYILAGETRSNNGQVTGFHGIADWWVVRNDATGTLLWQRALGGSGSEIPRAVVQTMDGGFVVAGSSGSTDGDLIGVASTGRGWVVKLDADGEIQWQHRYGSSPDESTFWAMEQTATGELLLAGTQRSTTDDPGCNQGGFSNAWLVKLDSAGELLWERCYGGSSDEIFLAMDLTDDGGCILTGRTSSNDGDVFTNNGLDDLWVVKVDQQGDFEWGRSFGGSNTDLGLAIRQTNDGGYVAAGSAWSNNGDVTGHNGLQDVWVVRLNATGDLLWQQAIGGSDREVAFDVLTHADGGFTIAGWTQSPDGDVSQLAGQSDAWLMRLDAAGTLLWEKTFGGTGSELYNSITRTNDGGFAILGGTNSNDGDVSGNHGGGDLWVVKLGAEPVGISEFIQDPLLSLFPNPTTGVVAVEVLLPRFAAMSFTWFDASGRALRMESTVQYPAGKQQITLDTEDLPSGPLLLQLQFGDQRLMRQVVKL